MPGLLALCSQPQASADEGLGPCRPLARVSQPKGRGGRLCPPSPAVSTSPWAPLCPLTEHGWHALPLFGVALPSALHRDAWASALLPSLQGWALTVATSLSGLNNSGDKLLLRSCRDPTLSLAVGIVCLSTALSCSRHGVHVYRHVLKWKLRLQEVWEFCLRSQVSDRVPPKPDCLCY